MSPADHTQLHAGTMALHRASEAVAEELERTSEMQRGGPDVEAQALGWITRNAQAFADLCAVKRRMLASLPDLQREDELHEARQVQTQLRKAQGER